MPLTPKETRKTCAAALTAAGFDVVPDRHLLRATRDDSNIEVAAAAARAPRAGVEGYPPLWKRSVHTPRLGLWFAAVLDTERGPDVFLVPSLLWARDDPGPFRTTTVDFTIHMSGRTVPDGVAAWRVNRAADRLALATSAGAVIQRELRRRGLPRTSPNDAARWLDDAGVLTMQKRTPGLPLRDLLRDAFELVPGAFREGRHWVLERDSAAAGDPMVVSSYRPADEDITIAKSATPATADPDAYGRGVRAHARLQNLVAAELADLGEAPYSPASHDPVQWDLRWDTPEAVWICEIKSTTSSNAESQTRAGMAQLLWYSHAIANANERRPVRMLLVLEHPPSDPRWAGLLNRLSITVASPDTLRSVLVARHATEPA